MTFSKSVHYDCDPDTLFGLLTDGDFVAAKYAGIGASNVEIVAVEETSQGWRIESKRDVESSIPGWAKKVLSPTNTIHQIDTWTSCDGDVKEGQWSVDVQGVPIKVSGTIRISPDGDGCRQEVQGKADVKIPLLGKRVAKLADEDTDEKLDAEVEFTTKHLAAG